MHPARREVEDVAFVYIVLGKHLYYGAILYHSGIFLWGYLLLEAGIEVGTGLCLQDVPHLALAHFVMEPARHLVVGMDLDAKVCFGLYYLGQQGHSAVFGIDLSAKYGLRRTLYYFGEALSLQRSVCHYALAARDCAYCPFLGSPNKLFIIWFKYKWIQIHLIPYLCIGRNKSNTVFTGLNVVIGTSTNCVFQLLIEPFHKPGSS